MGNARQPDMGESPLRSILLIGLIIGSVLLISVAGLAVYIVSRSSGTSTSGGGLLMPYNVELRAPPSTANTDPNAILPSNVASFSRKSLAGSFGAVTGSVSASYVSSSVGGAASGATVSIKVNLDANDDQAQTDFTRLVNGSPWKRDAFQQIRGAAFFQATDAKSGSVRFIFIQHYWLFDITANNKAVLDAFMAAYPY